MLLITELEAFWQLPTALQSWRRVIDYGSFVPEFAEEDLRYTESGWQADPISYCDCFNSVPASFLACFLPNPSPS